MSKFFINRPIVAMVISIVLVLVGALTILRLPVAQFPKIAPPEIQILATYVGADAQTLEQAVATPLEQQMNGVDNMNYMYSLNATGNSTTNLIVDFDTKTDPNNDFILAQSRETQAASQLPAEVNNYGITVRKSVTAPLMLIAVYSPHGTNASHKSVSGTPDIFANLKTYVSSPTGSTCRIRRLRNNIRIMRKNAPSLDSLFPSVRQGVLAATLGRPEKWWYLSELANFLHTRPSSLQRELSSLEQSGILQQRKDGRRTYFKAETRSPIFRELRSIFEKTVGLIPTLKLALGPFAKKITSAFVYGSMARREEHATSDVDLMVIGTVGLGDLVPSLRKAEKRLGREVNVTNYSVDEFRKKVADGDHFLTTVLKSSLQFVKGEQRDLDAIAGN